MAIEIAQSIVEALLIGVGFLWTAAWAIIMGLLITSFVQVYVSKERMAGVLGSGDIRGVTRATLFGAASSGCSFGAVAIAKGLFKKGDHVVNFLAFTLSGLLLCVYRRGLDTPGRYRDPVYGMRAGASDPSFTHDGETYFFCSNACKRAFHQTPDAYSHKAPLARSPGTDGHHQHH